MAWTYVFTPYIWPYLLTVLLLIVLGSHTWRQRGMPGALPFTFALLFGALWAAGSALEFAAVDPSTKVTWVKFQVVWQLPSAMAITCFLVEYTWPGRFLTRRRLVLLSTTALVFIAFILTDPFHHLVWRGFDFNGDITPRVGPVGWTGIAVGYSLVIVNFIVFAWLFIHSPQHRWFVALMLAGQVILRTLYMVDKIQPSRSDLPLEMLGIAAAYLAYSFALIRFNILSPVPLARQVVIDQMREGMIVVDTHGRVASLNPSAGAILGLPDGRACGRPLKEVLPSCALAHDGGLSEAEISLEVGPGTRSFLVAASSLKDWRGQEAGRLLLLHDVTEQHRAQAKILEQQRALAVLREREWLARELHDELAQDLAAINVQAQLVGGFLEAGQEEQAQAQLQALGRAARQAQEHVRGEIGKLSHRVDRGDGIVGSLRHLAKAFHEMCGIKVDLALPEDPLASSLAPTAEVQVARIVQEAFANIRKHAGATHVRVILTQSPGCLDLRIEDDGVGFDPDRLRTAHQAFGLGIMSQRAEEVGGRVQVQSAPGKGTKVIIEVPLNQEAG